MQYKKVFKNISILFTTQSLLLFVETISTDFTREEKSIIEISVLGTCLPLESYDPRTAKYAYKAHALQTVPS